MNVFKWITIVLFLSTSNAYGREYLCASVIGKHSTYLEYSELLKILRAEASHLRLIQLSDRVYIGNYFELLATTPNDETTRGISSYSGTETVNIEGQTFVRKIDFTAENMLLPGAPGTADDYLVGNLTQSENSFGTFYEKLTCLSENAFIPYGKVYSDNSGWHVSVSFSESDSPQAKYWCEQTLEVTAKALKRHFIIANIAPCATGSSSPNSYSGRIDFRW